MSRNSRASHTPLLRRRPLAIALAAAMLCAPVGASPPPPTRPDGDFVDPVTNCADAGPGSLRDVLATAFDGDHVAFDADVGCSVVTLTSGPLVIANDPGGAPIRRLDITGLGRDALTIDGGGLDRVFVHDAGADAELTLRDLAITGGQSDGSGGCILAHGSIVLSNVEVSACKAGVISGDATLGNSSVRGGAIYAAQAATFTGSIVTSNHVYGNTAYVYGGGVFAASSITADSSTIANNFAFSEGGAAYGGGLAAGDRAANAQAIVTLTSSVVTQNTAESHCGFCGARGGGLWTYGNTVLTGGGIGGNTAFSTYGYSTGGGIYFNGRFDAPPVTATAVGTNISLNSADSGGAIAAGGDLQVSRAVLDGNVANRDGGAILLFGGNLSLSDSSVADNAAYRGAGIFVFGYGDAAITNSTIARNSAGYGAGIGNTYGSLHVANSTIADNHARGRGGGIYFRYAYYPVDLQSTIIAGNTGANGIDTPEDIWPPGMTVTGSNDLVVAADGVTLPADTLRSDPMLLALDSYGGGTLTMALAEGSPAIDAGSNPLSLTYDQRGEGFVRVFGAAADIGALEVQPVTPDIVFRNGFDP